MDANQRVAENVYAGVQAIEELDKSLTRLLDELAAAAENPTAEEICQAHILAALIGKVPAEGLNELTYREEWMSLMVEIAYGLARKMTLRNITSRKSTDLEKNGSDG